MASKKSAKEKDNGKGKKEEVKEQGAGDVREPVLKQPEQPKAEPKKMRQCGCCPVEVEPAGAGQMYFEAPDGHMILAENTTTQVRDRRTGAWINPSR